MLKQKISFYYFLVAQNTQLQTQATRIEIPAVPFTDDIIWNELNTPALKFFYSKMM